MCLDGSEEVSTIPTDMFAPLSSSHRRKTTSRELVKGPIELDLIVGNLFLILMVGEKIYFGLVQLCCVELHISFVPSSIFSRLSLHILDQRIRQT